MPDEKSHHDPILDDGAQLIYGTSEVKRDVLYFWVLCALEKECMAPPGAGAGAGFGCSNSESADQKGNSCHLYDRSVLAILLDWAVGFDWKRFLNNDV